MGFTSFFLMAIIGTGLLIVGVLWPLEQISRHASAKYGQLKPLNERLKKLTRAGADLTDRDRRSGSVLLRGLMGLMLLWNLGTLCLAPSDARFESLPFLAIGLLYFGGQYARRRSRTTPRALLALEAEQRVAVSCPNCRREVFLLPDRSGPVVCPVCDHRFHASTKPLLVPALLWGVLVIAGWSVLVRPWPPDGASPFAALVGSVLAGGSIWLIQKISGARRRYGGRRQVNLSLLSQLAFVFWVMAGVAAAFIVVELAIWQFGSVDRTATLGAIAQRQKLLASVVEVLSRYKVVLWIDGGIFVVLSGLMIAGSESLIQRVAQLHKHAKTALKAVTMTALGIGSFSLAGAAVGPHLAQSANGAHNRLNATANTAVANLERAVAEQLVVQVVESLPTPPKRDPCMSDEKSDVCKTLGGQLTQQAQLAKLLGSIWSPKARSAGLPGNPAMAVVEEAEAWQKALTSDATPASLKGNADTWRDLPPSLTQANFERAIQALGPTDAAASKLRKDMVGRAVDLLSASTPIPDFDLGAIRGPFAEKLYGVFTGAVREPFDAAVRDVAAEILELCRRPANCKTAVRQRLSIARKDPRVARFGESVATLADALSDGGKDALRRTTGLNDQAILLVRNASRAALMAEQASYWGKVRAGWTLEREALSRLPVTDEKYPAAALMQQWRLEKWKIAVANPGLTAEGWDSAFLDFVSQEPARAAAFDYIVRKTPGTGVAADAAIGDGLRRFASKGGPSQIAKAELVAAELRAAEAAAAKSAFWRRLLLILAR